MTGAAVDAKWTEREVFLRLHRRYGEVAMNARRYAVAEHVPNATGSPSHIADFIAFDLWRTKLLFHGHEFKCSRADWLAELKQPWKAEAIKKYMHHWWLVATGPAIVKDDELPEGWGLIVASGKGLRAVKAAPRLTPEPMPQVLVASFARAVQKTASSPLFVEAAQSQFGTTMTELATRNRRLEALLDEREKELRRLNLQQLRDRHPERAGTRPTCTPPVSEGEVSHAS
jgi:hypothetical protein